MKHDSSSSATVRLKSPPTMVGRPTVRIRMVRLCSKDLFASLSPSIWNPYMHITSMPICPGRLTWHAVILAFCSGDMFSASQTCLSIGVTLLCHQLATRIIVPALCESCSVWKAGATMGIYPCCRHCQLILAILPGTRWCSETSISAWSLSLTNLVATLDHCETLIAETVTVLLPTRLWLAPGACDVCAAFDDGCFSCGVGVRWLSLCCRTTTGTVSGWVRTLGIQFA